jgi:serine/threonine protein phosphatase 1
MSRKDEEHRHQGRLFAVGDVHGCSTALRTLIDAIDPRPEDTIVTLGDYIDWGPDSRGVIDLLIGLSGRCHLVPLLGNHEEMLLAALESESELRSWLQFGGEETLNSYQYDGGRDMIPEGHVRFIRDCRDFYETPTHIFVHAN